MSKEDEGASSLLAQEESSQSDLAALNAKAKELQDHIRALDKERHDLSIDTSRKDNQDQIKALDRTIHLANQEVNTLHDQINKIKAKSSSKTELGGVKQKTKRQQEKPDNNSGPGRGQLE